MTTDLEQQFFKTFGIEPKIVSFCGIIRCVNQDPINNCTKDACPFWVKDRVRYPQITDRHLLELICIYLDYRVLTTQMSVKHLKQTVLQGLIELHEQYNHKIGYYEEVQALFKEG